MSKDSGAVTKAECQTLKSHMLSINSSSAPSSVTFQKQFPDLSKMELMLVCSSLGCPEN